MVKHVSLGDFLILAKTEKRVAIYREISADCLTPISIVEQLSTEMEDGALFESGLNQHKEGRYSYIAFGSIAELSAHGTQVTQRVGDKTKTDTASPFTLLRQLCAELACKTESDVDDFMTGAMGFVSYDAIRVLESIPDKHLAAQPLPDLFFKFFHTSMMFDHLQHRLLISKIVETTGDVEQHYHTACQEMDALVEKITQATGSRKVSAPVSQEPQSYVMDSDVSDDAFIQLVARAKHHIVEGDVFQMVLSRSFRQSYRSAPFDIYRALRRVSPAPYMFYFPYKDTVMVGASPEKLMSVRQGEVTVNPIAGTRRRSCVEDELKNTAELLSDEKELAEHKMLVDLARNDLGAVCEPGTITVKTLMDVKHFSHVSHICSEVIGQLRPDKDAIDAFCASFPAGTVSGAPKIRAMQLIDHLETSKRGLYGGALCRIDFQGHFDSCIAIRMAVLQDGIATVRTGAGIVYDSNPAAEAAETRHKAQGLFAAIALAEESVA